MLHGLWIGGAELCHTPINVVLLKHPFCIPLCIPYCQTLSKVPALPPLPCVA